MFPLQLQMGAALVEFSEEREATATKLKRVRELEHQLERAQRWLAIERAFRDELKVETSHRAQELHEAEANVTESAAQVEVLRKQFELLKGQSSKFEARTVTADERANMAKEETSLLKQELPKRLEESAHEVVVGF